ncbi:aspartate carbamoyltransferase regulatory subunit [Pyrodictium abyssi]|uniref:Aspartate carbamoyltransferase regulatory chain n=1 Tax=Pyrodictium abyssi TaxID=54256 RepID=A0ABN6ZKQ7_9CREN|nr:aspartate carbamoyltransferase regulatory subunit [Pyrodictium abyssi]
MTPSEGLLVRRIREGTVIDHIPAGRALAVLRILGITGREGLRVAVVMNVESRRLGRKDIVKVEGRHLSSEEVNRIALIAPSATINIVKGYQVIEKKRVKLPSVIEGIVACTNPTCITRKPREPLRPRFRILAERPLQLQCTYCGTIIDEEDVLEQLEEAGEERR